MKNFILFLTIVCFVTLSIKIIPQMKQSYIITINDSLNLSPYLNSDGYINTNMLNEFMNSGGNGNSLLSDFNSFIKLANPTSLRKLLRKVPYDIKQLHSKRGIDFNLNEIHRLHVIETYEKIDFEKIKSFNCITSIIPNIVTKVDEWPPNDPNYSSQTQFWSTNYNLNLPVAWQYTDGNSGIKIGILDHGVDYRHTDLGAGFGEGYRIRGGWDWKDNDGNPLPDLSNSVIENHGTPIAGILGALNNNGIGVIGIAGGWNTVNSGSQIFSFRVSSDQLDEDGRRYIDHTLIAEALIEAVTDPSINNGYGYGINVVNCSFGGITPNYWDWSSLFYHSYYNAFMWSILNNAVVVASRGNEASNSPRYPASFSNGKILLSVSGVDNFGIFYSQSSYGDGVSLSANWSLGLTTKNNFSYGSFGGTSNSAPFVSGSSALLFAKYLERNINVFSEDIQQILKISTQDAGASGYDQYYGYGRLDIAKALYMSSEKFNLTHLFANVDRNIINVSNPGANLALYYPYGLYPIIETKQLTESVDLPAYFESDSVWTWGNTYTWGVEWSNPSYGLPGATFVSKVGRRITYKTYIYKLTSIGGGPPFWWPCSPEQAKINISILGKQLVAPLIANITQNPVPIYKGTSGYVYCNLSQGNGTLRYNWISTNQPNYISLDTSGNSCQITYLNVVESVPGDGPTWDFGCTVSNPSVSGWSDTKYFTPSLNSLLYGCPTLAFDNRGTLTNENPLLITSMSNPGKDVTDHYLINEPLTANNNKINLTIHEPQTEHTWFDNVSLLETQANPGERIVVNDEGQVINYKDVLPVRILLNSETDITENLLYSDSLLVNLNPGDILTITRNATEGDGDVVIIGEEPPVGQKRIPAMMMNVVTEKQSDVIEEEVIIEKFPIGNFFLRPHKSTISKRLRNLPTGTIEITVNKKLILDYFVFVSDLKTSKTKTLPLLSATHSKNGNIRNKLIDIDQNYAEMYPTERIDLSFGTNTTTGNRAYILKTVGRYETDTTFIGKQNNLAKINEQPIVPTENKLYDNYPNPFNPSTIIKYSLKDEGRVTVKIFNTLGEEIRTLVDEIKPSGNYNLEFNANNLPSGVYIYRLQSGEFVSSKKMLLIK